MVQLGLVEQAAKEMAQLDLAYKLELIELELVQLELIKIDLAGLDQAELGFPIQHPLRLELVELEQELAGLQIKEPELNLAEVDLE